MIARRRRKDSGSDSHSSQSQHPAESQNQSAWRSTKSSSPSPSKPPRVTDPDMTCRDRSHEFMSVVKSLQSRQGNGAVPNHRNKALHQRSEFTQIAKRIGKDLANTFAKLEKLTICE